MTTLPGKTGVEEQEIAASQNIKERDYWLNQLSGNLVKTFFPVDFKKTAVKGKLLDSLKFRFPDQLFSRLMRLSNGYDHMLHMIFLAGVSRLLKEYTGNSDIILGAPIYKQDTDGDFINTVLALRNYLYDMTFKELLMQVKQTTSEANENQNYPFGSLLYKLGIPLSHQESSLFDVAVLVENIHDKKYIEHIHVNMIFSFNRKEDAIDGTVDFNSALYRKSTVEKLSKHLTNILEAALLNLDIKLSRIHVLNRDEREQLLYTFNDTKTPYEREKTTQQLFEEQVEQTPDNTALISEHAELTYLQLNEKANRLARALRDRGVRSDCFVGVILDRSLEMVIAVMAILKSGGAYVPLESHLPEERLITCLASLKVEWALTNGRQLARIDKVSEQLAELKYIFCLDEPSGSGVIEGEGFKNKTLIFNREIEKNPGENLGPTARARDIAYVIFTSGTTGIPKGVIETHRPVINIIQWVNNTFQVNAADKLLFVASLGFDLSVYDIFGVLAAGGSLWVAKTDDIKSPERLLEIIFQQGITFWDSAPAALQQLVPYIRDVNETRQYKNKSKMRLVFLSGDWIPLTLPDVLKEAFPGVNVIGLGGATEATIWSNHFPIENIDPTWTSIPYGKPIQNAQYYILDQSLHPCPIGVAGDLYIGGECLASGYINDIQLTTKKFIKNIYVPGEIIYKTGDMARWFPDGNIEFLGRQDNQVKIRGFRIELGEIESQLQRIKEIKTSVVMAKGDKFEDRYLCAYFIADKNLDPLQLKAVLAKNLPDYMIPSYFVRLTEMPVTPNGKLDRKALPEPVIEVGEDYVAPRNKIEKELTAICAQQLNIDGKKIGIDSNFFDLGAHSLIITRISAKIHKILDIKIPLIDIFEDPTVRGLSAYITSAETTKHAQIEPVEKKEYYDLSSAQFALYYSWLLEQQSLTYNVFNINVVELTINNNTIEDLFKKLTARHEILRTSFQLADGTPIQRIHDSIDFEVEYYDIKSEGTEAKIKQKEKELIKNFIRPFDLGQVPLFRVGVIEVSQSKNIFILDMHHIVTDALSYEVLWNDFMRSNRGEELPPLSIQYKDFSQWRNTKEQREKMKQQEHFWVKQFAHGVPVLNLPIDYERSAVKIPEGGGINFEIDPEETEELKKIAVEEGATLFMLLLAVYYIFLYKITGQEDMIIAIPTAGRSDIRLENLIGFFVNVLSLRNYPTDDKSFIRFFREVKENTLQAFENQDYQFEDLVKKVLDTRELNRNPLMDALFQLFNVQEWHSPIVNEADTAGAKIRPYNLVLNRLINDIYISGTDLGNRLLMTIEYNKHLFKLETIEKFAQYFKEVVTSVVKNKNVKLEDIETSYVLYEQKINNPQMDFSFA